MPEIEQLDGLSLDVAAEKRRALLALFPEAQAEGGQIDFAALRRALGDAVDAGSERYGLSWPGKAAAVRASHATSAATLLPVPERSVDFDSTGNAIVEGDNLEVLKLLQRAYAGAFKLIVIDPPYNTGRDFIYPDAYAEPLQTYLAYTGQRDANGRSFATNSESDGRYHSKWLTMMYPRVMLGRNLLRPDGLFCMSIGDAELANALALLNEIFGEKNRIGIVARVTKRSSNKGEHFAPSKDYLLVYARDAAALPPLMDEQDGSYSARFTGRDDRGSFATVGLYQAALDARPNQRYWVACPDGSLAIPPGRSFPSEQRDGAFVPPAGRDDKVWRWNYQSYLRRKERLVFKQTPRSPLLDPLGARSKWNVYTKYYLEDRLADGTRPRDVIEDLTNDKGAAALRALGLDDAFPFAKPVELIQRCLSWLADPDALCLDFFAGSGTTGHAVLAQNARDGGRRRYLLVQLPEPLAEPGFPTIAHVTQERMRRAGRALGGDAADDRGFRVFRLAESNLPPHLAADADRAGHDRSELDLLYEVVLKSGYPLSSRIERCIVAGAVVHRVSGGALLLCFESRLQLGVVREIAALTPQRVVLLERAFDGNDHLKANAAQIFRASGSVLQTI